SWVHSTTPSPQWISHPDRVRNLVIRGGRGPPCCFDHIGTALRLRAQDSRRPDHLQHYLKASPERRHGCRAARRPGTPKGDPWLSSSSHRCTRSNSSSEIKLG